MFSPPARTAGGPGSRGRLLPVRRDPLGPAGVRHVRAALDPIPAWHPRYRHDPTAHHRRRCRRRRRDHRPGRSPSDRARPAPRARVPAHPRPAHPAGASSGPDGAVEPDRRRPTALPTARPVPKHELFGFVPYWEMNDDIADHLARTPLTTLALFSVTHTKTGKIDTKQTGYKRITGRDRHAAHPRGARSQGRRSSSSTRASGQRTEQNASSGRSRSRTRPSRASSRSPSGSTSTASTSTSSRSTPTSCRPTAPSSGGCARRCGRRSPTARCRPRRRPARPVAAMAAGRRRPPAPTASS